jgi:hypothetical protein
VYLFSAVMGLLWLSTVPPTNAIVAQIFGVQYMSMLGGFVFLSHQVGSFMGVWLGGKLYDMTGSYSVVWWLAVALSVMAALANLPVREAPSRGPPCAPHEARSPCAACWPARPAGAGGGVRGLPGPAPGGRPGQRACGRASDAPCWRRALALGARWAHLLPAGGPVLDVACGSRAATCAGWRRGASA